MNPILSLRTVTQCIGRIPVTLIVGFAALAIAFVPSAGAALQFDRTQLAAGEIWRLATCHLTHWNAEHLQWDLLMFLVLGAACEWRNPRRMWWCVAVAAAAVTLLVFVQFPQMGTYRGLSGIDTALFALLAIELYREARHERNRVLSFVTGGLLTGFAAKTAYEAATGHTFFVDQEAAGFVPLVWDHVVAALVGAIFALAKFPQSTPLLPAARPSRTSQSRLVGR